MRVTQHIYHLLQQRFPDLFIEDEKSKESSTVFAEFLPGAALADPNGNPWGQYSNRDIPLKRKTIVISFNMIADLRFGELEKIDKIARFLKRAGFNVLIPVDNALQKYDQQLFDREHINQVGNKTRAEMQRMALGHNIPADEVFFIDEVKKELDEKYVDNVDQAFQSIEEDPPERAEDVYVDTEFKIKFISKNVGKLTISKNIPSFLVKEPVRQCKSHEAVEQEVRAKIETLSDPVLKSQLLPRVGYVISMVELGDSFLEVAALEPELIPKSNDELINYMHLRCEDFSLSDLLKLPQKSRSELIINSRHLLSLLYQQVDFSELAALAPELISVVLKRIDFLEFFFEQGLLFSEFFSLETELILNLFENADKIFSLFQEKKFYLVDLIKQNQKTPYPDFKDFPLLISMIEQLKKIKKEAEKKSPYLMNLYYLNLQECNYTLQKNFVMPYFQSLEELNISNFLHYKDSLENLFFQNLISLHCGGVDGQFSIRAPKLISLTLDEKKTPGHWRGRKEGMSIFLEQLPLLNRLQINFEEGGPRTKEDHPIINSVKNQNLIELYIDGNITSLDFINPLLVNSLNLKKLVLINTSVPEEDLKICGQCFPNLKIEVVSRYIERYLGSSIGNYSGSISDAFQEETGMGGSSAFGNNGFPVPRSSSTAIVGNQLEIGNGSEKPLQSNPPISSQSREKDPNAIYAASTSKELTSDFDTKHDPESTFTLTEVCRHLSLNKKNRFEYIRTGVYTFNDAYLLMPIQAGILSNYELPLHQSTLPSDDIHDFYELNERVNVAPNHRIELKSLSAQDRLFSITLNGKPLQETDIEITKSDLGFYTLTAKKALIGNLAYVLDVLPEKNGSWNKIPNALQEIIATIQSFPSSGSDALDLTALNEPTAFNKILACYFQEKGACRHRPPIFLLMLKLLKAAESEKKDLLLQMIRPYLSKEHYASALQSKDFSLAEFEKYIVNHANLPNKLISLFQTVCASQPNDYAHITARACQRSGIHVDLEISVDNEKTFETLDFGGYECKEQYPPMTLPVLQFSSKQHKEAPKPIFSDVLNQIKEGHGKNMFLCLQQSSDIETCLFHIRQTASERPVFYVDSPDQLRTSLRRLNLNADRTKCSIVDPPAGLLHDFLMANQESDPPPIIVINWENFKQSEIVQFNSVFDVKNRRVDNTLIPRDTMIVGLHARSEKMRELVDDKSIASRQTGGVIDLTTTTLPLPVSEAEAPSGAAAGVLSINLHQSPRWQDMLIGKAYVDGDQLRWQDGALAKLIPPSSIAHVEFINPPLRDRAFNLFVADLRRGAPLVFLNQVIPIKMAIDVKINEKLEFANGVSIAVTRSDLLVRDAFVINASTFEQCLHGKKITSDGLLIAEKGLLEAHANKTLKLCLSDKLSDSQWSLLLDYAKKFNVALDLTVMQKIKLPNGIAFPDKKTPTNKKSAPKKSVNQFIVSDDIEYSVRKMQLALKTEAVDVDFSAYKKIQEQVTQCIVIDLSEVAVDDLFCKIAHKITQAGFDFNQKTSAIWEALSLGKTVILKGACSQEMLNYLATLFSPEPYFYMGNEKHFFPGKLIVISEDALKWPSWLPVEKQTISLAEKQTLLDLPIDGTAINKSFIQLILDQKKALVSPPPPLREAKEKDQDLSLSACEIFEKNRLLSVKHVLSYSPFVLLEGAPGVGKSYFIRTFENDPSIQFYRENEIEQWATDVVSDGVQKILFRDEINLRGIDCSQDRDLLNNPPSIFISGKYYALTDNCKIMYAQNPLEYGGERFEPQLFRDLPDCKVVFEQMSRAFILHRILKPIFETTFHDAIESEKRATEIIDKHFSSMRSIRDLQAEAIFECALTHHSIPPAPVSGTKETCLGLNDFVLTASRFEPYKDVLTLLAAREFKRELPSTAPDGARFNGANGLVLQGPPGVGKSEFIESVLKSEDYAEITANTMLSDIEKGKVYYRLRASVSIEEKLSILHKAFQEGAILIIDEIDSCPLLENYLNAYLVGGDIHGKRPKKPGFTILSTANGAEMKGRRILPAPLKSRMLALAFDEYPREDLVAILNAKFISPGDAHRELKLDMIAFLVDGFVTEQQTNRETPTTFRDLYVVAENYFKNHFAHYVELGLSKEQHDLMLVYRNHPKISQFMDRFNSQELKANRITLDEMEKALKSGGLALTFFSKEKYNPQLDSGSTASVVITVNSS